MEKIKKVNYFERLKIPLKIVGISLTADEGMPYKIYSTIIRSLALLYGAIFLCEMFKHDFNTVINTLLYQFSVFIAITKTIMILLKKAKLVKLMENLEIAPFLPDLERGGEVEEKLVNQCVWITNLQTTAYWVLFCTSIFLSLMAAVIRRIRSPDPNDWEFPYGPVTIINVTYSPNFEIILGYQVTSMLCLGGYFCAADLMAATTLAHISCQFKMLRHYIRNIVKISYRDMLRDQGLIGDYHDVQSNCCEFDASLVTWKYLKRGLANVVKYHLAIIKIAEDLEDIMSGLLLVVFVTTLGMTALMVYRVSLISFSDNRIYATIGETLIGCGQTLILCFWGEQILNESQLVANAVFGMDFIGTDVRFQKGLVLILRRSQKPVVISAKGFVIIGLFTFAWIMQKSYTAYMFLQNAKS